MSGKLLKDVTFNKVCDMLKKQTPLWDDIKALVKALATIAPKLVVPDLTAGITLGMATSAGQFAFDGIDIAKKAYGVAKRLVARKDDTSYVTRAENAQAANVLIIYTAYFDTIRQIIPDADKNIFLGEMQPSFVERSAQSQGLYEHQEEFLYPMTVDRSFSLPNVLDGPQIYQSVLKKYYSLMTQHLRCYLNDLAYYEKLPEHKKDKLNAALNEAPEKAWQNYWAQYLVLASDSPEFFVLATHQEHVEIKKNIDRGFNDVLTKLENMHHSIDYGRACDAFVSLDRQYRARIQKPIIGSEKLIQNELEMELPTIDEIYIPQAYKWLQYEENFSLEATDAWKDGGSIGEDIANVLRHPELGTKPMLILGDPGAGKTTLCHMIAGKLLRHEYHTIILYLRDLNADSSVAEQLSQQLKKTCYCDWSTIVRSKPTKPILLLFDGYDELLQATGNTYSDYIQKIVEFQEELWDSQELIVRSIITSRTALIDKANIPVYTTVFQLQPMDEERINAWCSIWNKKNRAYYSAKALNPFRIEAGCNVAILAKEPLLLAMLAMYDANNNALQNNQNLKATELYYRLIRDFVEREMSKNEKFRGLEDTARNDEISKEINRLAIAALGMYNREELHITSNQLEKDFQLLITSDEHNVINHSELLFGRFFFVRQMQAKRNDRPLQRAYTFLHNTFGEFLTAYYITSQLVACLVCEMQRDRREMFQLSQQSRECLYLCLAYAPLFRHPKVCDMLREWFPLYVKLHTQPEIDFSEAIKRVVEREVVHVLRGELLDGLTEATDHFQRDDSFGSKKIFSMMNYWAIYSNNLMVLAALVAKGIPLDRIENEERDAWQKLLHFWRISFDESSIVSFAGQYCVNKSDDECLHFSKSTDVRIRDFDYAMKHPYSSIEQAASAFRMYNALAEKPARDILGTLLGILPISNDSITPWLRTKGLLNKLLMRLINRITKNSLSIYTMENDSRELTALFVKECIQYHDFDSLYIYIAVLNCLGDYVNTTVFFQGYFDIDCFFGANFSDICNHPCLPRLLLELAAKLLPLFSESDHSALRIVAFNIDSASDDYLIAYHSLLEAYIKIINYRTNRSRRVFSVCNTLLQELIRELCDNPENFSLELVLRFCLVYFSIFEIDQTCFNLRIYQLLQEVLEELFSEYHSIPFERRHISWQLLCKTIVHLQAVKSFVESKPSYSYVRKHIVSIYIDISSNLADMLYYLHFYNESLLDILHEYPQILPVLCDNASSYSQYVVRYLASEFIMLIKTYTSEISVKNHRALMVFADMHHYSELKEVLTRIK